MAGQPHTAARPDMVKGDVRGVKSYRTLDADIIIANAPDPVFVSDLEGKSHPSPLISWFILIR